MKLFFMILEYWVKLKELQNKTSRPFYKNKTKKFPNGRTIFDLEEIFKQLKELGE